MKIIMVLGILLLSVTLANGKEERWQNFAEDADLKYYLDRKTVVRTPEDTATFWVKSVAKNREYFKNEYNLNELAYIMTNYELDCSRALFRVRETILLTKNRKELSKTLVPLAEMPEFEPVTPESVTELAQEAVCEEESEEFEPQAGNAKVLPSTQIPDLQ
jgi:hypothetical protein